MRKVLNGRVYDTDKARLVGEWENGFLPDNVEYITESLYCKRNGEFFLHGEGGAMTMYASTRGSHWRGGEQIIPYDYDSAVEWAQEHLGSEAYEAEFGEVAEDDETATLSCIVSISTMQLIRRAARRDGVTIATVIERLAQALKEG